MHLNQYRCCLFEIYNRSYKELTLVDFIKENIYIVDKVLGDIDISARQEYYDNIIKHCKKNNTILKPDIANILITTDYRDNLEWILDYGLRSGGVGRVFKWRFRKFYYKPLTQI